MEQQDCPQLSSLDIPDPEGARRLFEFRSKQRRRGVKSGQRTTAASSLSGGGKNCLRSTDEMVANNADLLLPNLLDSASIAPAERGGGGLVRGTLQLNVSYLEGICGYYAVGVLQPQGFSDG